MLQRFRLLFPVYFFCHEWEVSKSATSQNNYHRQMTGLQLHSVLLRRNLTLLTNARMLLSILNI